MIKKINPAIAVLILEEYIEKNFPDYEICSVEADSKPGFFNVTLKKKIAFIDRLLNYITHKDLPVVKQKIYFVEEGLTDDYDRPVSPYRVWLAFAKKQK